MMLYRKITVGLLLTFLCEIALAQYNFDSIKICHTKERALKYIEVGEYEVHIDKGKLVSFASKDNVVNYQEDKKLLVLKNLQDGNYLKLELSSAGIIFSTKDTSVTINSPSSVKIGQPDADKKYANTLFGIGVFTVSLEFEQEKIKRISFAVSNKYITILVYQSQGVFTWNFAIETGTLRNPLTCSYNLNKINTLNIHDDDNKVGVRLYSPDKGGIFKVLQGLRVYENNLDGSDTNYTLHYTNSGILKQRKSQFDLSCSY